MGGGLGRDCIVDSWGNGGDGMGDGMAQEQEQEPGDGMAYGMRWNKIETLGVGIGDAL